MTGEIGKDPAISDPALAAQATTSTPSARNLLLRAASAAILAPLAIGSAYVGDWPFTVFWTLAAIAVWWEWIGLVQPVGRYVVLATGVAAIALAALLFEVATLSVVGMMIALGILAGIVTAGRNAVLVACGMIYASAVVIAPALLRSDPRYGFAAILLLFAVVWGTDIAGYFAGRAFGGPTLAPSISPKKTWSGAIGGTSVAILAALAVAHSFSIRNQAAIAAVAVVLSVASQAGDLFESHLKRRFDAKDASGLIPGHGGVMDRLDGFIFASVVAAAIGVSRGGLELPGTGLLIW